MHRGVLAAVSAAALVVAPPPAAAAAAAAAEPAVPDRMAALGDSITRAFDACAPLRDCVEYSWSTGTGDGLDSHHQRLARRNERLTADDNAVTGAKVADLNAQAEKAVDQRAGYVTILIGANDACTRSEARMTSVADYETRLRTAMGTLRTGLPDALIFVSSIPDLRRLWQVGKDNAAARTVWSLAGICQSMLARPTSTAAADEQRRERVRRRVIDYNKVLERVCAQDRHCRFDGNEVFSYPFTLEQVSKWDYFHPNRTGQAVLARVTYARSFWPAEVFA